MTRFLFLGLASVAAIISSAAHATETITYSYDTQGRLTKTVVVTTANGKTVTTTYTIDKADNRTNVTVTGA